MSLNSAFEVQMSPKEKGGDLDRETLPAGDVCMGMAQEEDGHTL